jgi:hypothetical protein
MSRPSSPVSPVSPVHERTRIVPTPPCTAVLRGRTWHQRVRQPQRIQGSLHFDERARGGSARRPKFHESHGKWAPVKDEGRKPTLCRARSLGGTFHHLVEWMGSHWLIPPQAMRRPHTTSLSSPLFLVHWNTEFHCESSKSDNNNEVRASQILRSRP